MENNNFNVDEEWDALWNNTAPAETKDFDELPDGNYTVKVETVEFKEAKSGNKYINWQLTVLTGKFTNRRMWKRNMLLAQSLPYLKKDLLTLGHLPESMRDLNLELYLDIVLLVTQKSKPGKDGKMSAEIYFNKRLKEDEIQVEAEKPEVSF